MIILKNIFWSYIKKTISVFFNFINSLGNKKECNICRHTFNHFSKYRGGTRNIPENLKLLKIVGSDFDNFGCIFCNSHDRERHLFLFFDKLNLWDKFKNSAIIHIAPEDNLSLKISKQSPFTYILGDLYANESKGIIEVDITKMQFEDNSFDFVICNHVLEHIPDYKKALREIYRILKPSGSAILQTPFSRLLVKNFEEEKINTYSLRNFFYGQEDHVRVFGEGQFLDDLKHAGFELNIQKHLSFFDDKTSDHFGVNKDEDLILVLKPVIGI